MAIETDQDRLALLRDFGEHVQFSRDHHVTVTTTGILDINPQLFEGVDGTYISNVGVRLYVTTAAASNIALHDTAAITDKVYSVVDITDDTTGIVVLTLQRAA